MDAKFFNGLFEGDSPNGAKLGMGLTGGDFWPRPGGCLTLYRGRRWWEVDFGMIVAVGEAGAGLIVSKAAPLAGQTCYFAVRGVSGRGEEDMSLSTMVRAVFDAAGDLQPPTGRNVIALCARQVAQSAVRLLWRYCPYHAPIPCEWFNVYSDNGTGVIDFENPVSSVACAGAGIYSDEQAAPGPGRYRFCVRRQSQAGIESGLGAFAAIDVSGSAPAGIDHLDVRVV
jgi:hypothetical protein